MSNSIIAATGNPGKLKEIRRILSDLNISVRGLENWADIQEPVEDGKTFADNARIKAMYYARMTGELCLADDSGLCVDVLNGAPGVHSARFAANECPPGSTRQELDQANNRKLIKLLKNVPCQERAARFVCHLALASPSEILIESRGVIEGHIIDECSGKNGFGYDPYFYVSAKGCTAAELSDDQKNIISHRGNALRKFVSELSKSTIMSMD